MSDDARDLWSILGGAVLTLLMFAPIVWAAVHFNPPAPSVGWQAVILLGSAVVGATALVSFRFAIYRVLERVKRDD